MRLVIVCALAVGAFVVLLAAPGASGAGAEPDLGGAVIVAPAPDASLPITSSPTPGNGAPGGGGEAVDEDGAAGPRPPVRPVPPLPGDGAPASGRTPTAVVPAPVGAGDRDDSDDADDAYDGAREDEEEAEESDEDAADESEDESEDDSEDESPQGSDADEG